MIWVNKTSWVLIAAINGLLAVIMSAVAAHAINNPQAAVIAEKASLYQLIHAVVLVVIANRQGRFYQMGRWAFLLGIILFSGTLYTKSLTEWSAVAKLAPMGGVSLMVGWLLLVCAGYDEK